jgi:hypothetical protein
LGVYQARRRFDGKILVKASASPLEVLHTSKSTAAKLRFRLRRDA